MKTIELFNKQFKVFLLIAYGIPYIMGIFMAFGYFTDKDLSIFPLVQMLCPAMGVIVAILTGDQHKELIPRYFFRVYIAITVIGIMCAVTSVFALNKELNTIFQLIATVGSIGLLLTLLLDEDIKLKAFGIIGKSWKNVGSACLLFFILYLARMAFSYFLADRLADFIEIVLNPKILFNLLYLIPNFFLSFAFFFGEEYGWRFYLQPLIQKKFGAIKATLIVGFMWGIWHMPLNIFYYNMPDNALYSIILQIVGCTILGIFFAYFYMKTQNVWCPILFHYLNNNLTPVLLDMFEPNSSEPGSIASIGLAAAINFCFLGLFIFTKFYRNPKNRSETLEEHVAKFE